MRLLIVSQYFWPENFRVNDFASELISRGHEVTVLTGLPNYPGGKVFEDYRANPAAFSSFEGSPVFRVPVIPRGSSSLFLVLNYFSFALSGLIWGPGKLRGRQIDAIFVFQTSPITSAIPAVWLRWRKRAVLSMWVLDLWPETLSAIGVVKSRLALGLVGQLVRMIYKRCDLILVQSRAFFRNVEHYCGSPAKIRYFPGWAELVFDGEAPTGPLAEELAPYADKFKLLFAGNIGQAQDFPAIIAAADQLRDCGALRWIIAGDGRAAEEVRADVKRRGLEEQVVFLGRFPIERMPEFFHGADALLVSLADEPIWSMTIPGKVQSYFASGKPLIGMLNGEGARVIEEAGAGLVGRAGDAEALAANVRAMMAMSSQQRAEQGKNGKSYCAREFNRTTLIDSFEAWVASVQDTRNGVD